jgi:hypothetical protein
MMVANRLAEALPPLEGVVVVIGGHENEIERTMPDLPRPLRLGEK